MQHIPFTDTNLKELSDLLSIKASVNAEQLHGFMTALICAPALSTVNACFAYILPKDIEFDSMEQVQQLTNLLMTLWNDIAFTLNEGLDFAPIMVPDDNNNINGNDWAIGFQDAMASDPASWGRLMNDDDNGGYLMSIIALAHEHDEDPKMRSFGNEVPDEQKRKILLRGLSEGVPVIYAYFETDRKRTVNKLARAHTSLNAPCPCGSGKKYKRCCEPARKN